MPLESHITIGDLAAVLRRKSFAEKASSLAVERVIDALAAYCNRHAPIPGDPFQIETQEGLGFKDFVRDALVVSISDDDILTLDDADRALEVIEATLASKSETKPVQLENLGSFKLRKFVPHTLTPAEQAWFEKMKEDGNEAAEEYQQLRQEIKRTRRPQFAVTFTPLARPLSA